MNPIFEDTIIEKAFLSLVKIETQDKREKFFIYEEIKRLDDMTKFTMQNMQETVDERLTDYYIYMLKALHCKREYLTEYVKRMEV